MTIREWLSELAETPLMVRIGPSDYCDGMWGENWPRAVWKWPNVPADILDKDFDAGYGGDGPDLEVWTDTRVYYTHEYDGSTRLAGVDRNPPEDAA